MREKDNIGLIKSKNDTNNKEKIIKILFANNYENENTKNIDVIEPIKIEDNFESIYINKNKEIDHRKSINKMKDNGNDNIVSNNKNVNEKNKLNQSKNKDKEKKEEIDIINNEKDDFMSFNHNNDETCIKKENNIIKDKNIR